MSNLLSEENKHQFKPSAQALAIVFWLGTAFGSGVLYALNQTAPPASKQNSSTLITSQTITRIEYERLALGMSLPEVEATIAAQGIEVNRTQTTATLIWKNPDGSSITGIFEGGKLKSKQQYNLK